MNEMVLANRAADWRRLKMLVLDSVSSRGRLAGRTTPGTPHRWHIQAFIKGLGESAISAYQIKVWRQTSRVRVAGECADSHTHGRQLRENLAADVAGSSNDEDTKTIVPAEV